jgi:hypothetical protein
MIKKLLFFAIMAILPSLSNGQTQVLVDTSLEATGAGSSDWASTSTNFPTVLCDITNCGICGGPCGPHSGTYFAWFGGVGPTGEQGTLTQSFNVTTAGIGSLNFWLILPLTGVSADSLSAFLDGNLVWFKLGDDSVGFGTAYAPVTVSLGNISTGIHTLEFSGIETGAAATVFNILIDDITITVDAGNGISDYDFENGVTLYTNYQDHILNCAFDFTERTDLIIRINDMLGREVRTGKMQNVKKDYITFNTYGLTGGIYNVTFIKKGMVFTKQILIQE